MKKVFLIIGIIALVIGLLIGALFYFTADLVKAGDAFFASVKAKDIAGAHAQTSTAFQEKFTESKLESILETLGLVDVSEVSWSGRAVHKQSGSPSTGKLTGTATTAGGTVPIELELVKDGDLWKVQGIWRTKSDAGDEMAGTREPPTLAASSALVTRTTLKFGEAVNAGDLEPFYKATSPELQRNASLEKFVEAFDVFLGKGLDFTTLKDVDPVITNPPGLDKNAILRLEGYFPGSSTQVNFLYRFVYRDAEWKVLEIKIKLVKPTPAAEPEPVSSS